MARDSLIPFGFGTSIGMSADPLFALHREMNRLFADVMGEVGAGSGGAPRGGQGSASMLVPQMEISETQSEIRVTAELPGASENDMEVMLDDDVLTIRAEKKIERSDDRKNVRFTERGYGVFQRSIRLPVRVKPDEVRANFANGVLTITVPKSQAQEAGKRVQIEGARAAGQAGDGQSASSSDGGPDGSGSTAARAQNTSTSAPESGGGTSPSP